MSIGQAPGELCLEDLQARERELAPSSEAARTKARLQQGLVIEKHELLTREVAYVRTRKGLASGEPLVAVALSGGGVRSATISLGFLKELTRAKVLPNVDYLSSVSGGGYASGYLLSAAQAFRGDHSRFFCSAAEKELLAAGEYLASTRNWKTFFRGMRLLAATLSMAALNLLWVLALLGLLASALSFAAKLLLPPIVPLLSFALGGTFPSVMKSGDARSDAMLAVTVLLGLAATAPLLRLGLLAPTSALVILVSKLKNQAAPQLGRTANVLVFFGKLVNWAEGVALALGAGLLVLLASLAANAWIEPRCALLCGVFALPTDDVWPLLVITAVALLICLLVPPAVIGLNSVFRNLIDSAYFAASWRAAGKQPDNWHGSVREPLLKDAADDPRLPYPLFNAGLYLRAEKDDEFAGTQTMDYFVFTPNRCGAALVDYASTDEAPYNRTTLAEAVGCSAASISPLMDGRANPALALPMALFNLNLGIWLYNPKRLGERWWRRLLKLWPRDYVRLILGKLSTRQPLLHVADGGFIENLGVLELLRRRCKLIIAVDNTYDPNYEFKHLRNLVVRARCEEQLAIEFPEDLQAQLKPSPITGFARAQHQVAKITSLSGEKYEGRLVYVKACLTDPLWNKATPAARSSETPSGKTHRQKKHEPRQENDAQRKAVNYQAYHPHFPQETTADQFFDEDQWEAYFMLGRLLACDVLGQELGEETATPPFTRASLLERFKVGA